MNAKRKFLIKNIGSGYNVKGNRKRRKKMIDLKNWMIEEDISVKELAKKLGICQEYMRLIIAGKKHPGNRTAFAIENASHGKVKAISLIKKYEAKPTCPHCKQPL
jgi:hypothetical protein